MNIAIFGKSGSGKSYVSQLFVEHFGYQTVSTGNICRKATKLIFGDETKSHLNIVSEKMRELNHHIWIEAALRGVDEQRLIFDSIRYQTDFDYFHNRGYATVMIRSKPSLTLRRLKQRHQIVSQNDLLHTSENELEKNNFDFEIENHSDGNEELLCQINDIIKSI